MIDMKPPIDIIHLFPVLNQQLINFLRGLSPADWLRPTVAKLWNVKDVVAHLLDGNYRQLSVKRDKWTVEPDRPITSYQTLVDYLNQFNADWVKAAKRMSPQVLTDALELTNGQVVEIFRGLDPFAPSVYPVSWAGESMSKNWFDIAREFTERWLHQQQIRDAVGDKGIMTAELYYPVLNIFIKAWPVASTTVHAEDGALLKTTVTGEGGGEWFLLRSNGEWKLSSTNDAMPVSETIIDGDVAWKLFSKSVRKEDIKGSYSIKGNTALGETILNMVSVMA
jgi:uncharacterized protein (TIGR03083 family)